MSVSKLAALADLLLCAAAPIAAAFDKVLLHDGRTIEGKLLDPPDEEHVLIAIEDVQIPIRNELVSRTYVEDLEGYVPKNDEEREYLAKGWVLFEGRWMSKSRRDGELRKRAEEDRIAIEELQAEQDWGNARTFETLHFDVRSNCRQEVLDDYVERLEHYYKSFVGTWRITVAPSLRRQKQKFFLYRNAPDFYRYGGARPGTLGFFNWVDGELHVFHDDADPDFTISVLYHEGNHLLTFLIDPRYRYPIWMNEGMAEYFGSATIDEDGDLQVGALQYGRIATLLNDAAKGQRIGLEELMLTDQRDFTGRHYAPAWSFTHFLMEHPKYGKAYKAFFTKLPKNKKIETQAIAYYDLKGQTLETPDKASVIRALEKQLKRSLPQLEEEWLAYIDQSYGDLTANAYASAARLSLWVGGEPDDEAVETAFAFYDKAWELGLKKAIDCRRYAEMLRKGGIEERDVEVRVRRPDPDKALEVMAQAIHIDPVDPLNYLERGGALVLKGDEASFDEAERMVAIARALSPPDASARKLAKDLEKALAWAREKAAEKAAALAAQDLRRWIIQPWAPEGEPSPERIADLSTEDLLALVTAGDVGPKDWVFETTQEAHPETGEPYEGSQPWDTEWVALSDVPEFAAALPEGDG